MMAVLQRILDSQDKAAGHLAHIDKRMDRLDRRMDRLESQLDRMDERIDSLDASVRHGLELLAALHGDLAQHLVRDHGKAA